jgi:DNA-binding NarL/FixJ family response regulator
MDQVMTPLAQSRRGAVTPLRVLLIEAQATFRWGMRLLLDELPDITVVGEAGSGQQGLALLELAGYVDLIVTGTQLPDLDGAVLLRQAKAQQPTVRVLVLAPKLATAEWQRLAAAGADRYIRRDGPMDDFVAAIRALAHDGAAPGPQLRTRSRRRQRWMRRMAALAPRAWDALNNLGRPRPERLGLALADPCTLRATVSWPTLLLAHRARSLDAVDALLCHRNRAA